jgi:hypothetical protein
MSTPSPDELFVHLIGFAASLFQRGAHFRSVLAGPVLLTIIVIVHWAWFRLHLSSDGQQHVELVDLSDLSTKSCAGVHQRLTLLAATNKEFNAAERSSTDILFRLPEVNFAQPTHEILRIQTSRVLENCDTAERLICGEDLDIRGTCHFLGAVKVGGDLIVRGNAVFFGAVIVNGVIKIHGAAHFAEGVVAKGETFVTGDLSIGSPGRKGWAALSEFALASRLRLNGRIVTTRAVQIRKAA